MATKSDLPFIKIESDDTDNKAEDDKKQEEKKQEEEKRLEEEKKKAAQRVEREKKLSQSIHDSIVLMVTGVCPLEDLTIESITCVTVGDQLVKVAFNKDLGPKAEEAARRAREPKPEPKKPPVIVKKERYDQGYHGQYPLNNGPQRWMAPRHPGQPPRGPFPRQRMPHGQRMPQDPRMLNPRLQGQGQLRPPPHPNQPHGQSPRMPATRGRGRGRRPSQSPRQPTPPPQRTPVQSNLQATTQPVATAPINGSQGFNPSITSTPKSMSPIRQQTVLQAFQKSPNRTSGNVGPDSQINPQVQDQPPTLSQTELSTSRNLESMQPPQLTAQDVITETSQGLESMQISAETPGFVQEPPQEPQKTLADTRNEKSQSAVQLIAQGIAEEASEVLAQGSSHTTRHNLHLETRNEEFIGEDGPRKDVSDAVDLLMSFDGTPAAAVECDVTTTSQPTTGLQDMPVSYQQINDFYDQKDADCVGSSPRSSTGPLMTSTDPNMGCAADYGGKDSGLSGQLPASPVKKSRGRAKNSPKKTEEDTKRPGRKRGKQQGGASQRKRLRDEDYEVPEQEWATNAAEPKSSTVRRSSRARTAQNYNYQLMISEGTDEEDEPAEKITEPVAEQVSEEDIDDYQEEVC